MEEAMGQQMQAIGYEPAMYQESGDAFAEKLQDIPPAGSALSGAVGRRSSNPFENLPDGMGEIQGRQYDDDPRLDDTDWIEAIEERAKSPSLPLKKPHTTPSDPGSVAAQEEVLRYWFEGDSKELFKSRWFPDGPRQGQADEVVKATFGDLLTAAETGALQAWTETPRGSLALIIVLDQFSRHCYRGRPREEEIETNDRTALAVAEACLAAGWDKGLTVPEEVFLLMPLRHTPTVARLEVVLGKLDQREREERDHAELLIKFRRQTTRRMQVLKGKAEPGEDGEWDILAFHPFEADEAELPKEKLYKTMDEYLRARAKELQPEGLQSLCISISGGSCALLPCFGGSTPL